MDRVMAIVEQVGTLMLNQVWWMAGLAVLFTVMTLFTAQACNPGKVWWRNRDLATDLSFGLMLPIVTPYLKMGLLFVAALMFSGAMSEAEFRDYIAHGRGPVSALPLWGQAIVYVLLTDFLLYWSHRLFHGRNLWPFHAVHHAPEDVQWTTSYRAHPVNMLFGSTMVHVLMLVLGVAPQVMLWLVPFDILSAAFVHANLNWTLGPLKYVVATPVFHRWHHGPPHLGGEKNFAPTFAFWDVLFGTFYMPEGQLPEEYGVDDPDFPKDFVGQIVVPFVQFVAILRGKPKAPASLDPAG